MSSQLQVDPKQIAAICETHHVRKVSVFGFAVRDDFDASRSDVDVLVEFEDLPVQGYASNYFALHDPLVRLFGRPADRLTDTSIRNRSLRKAIDRDRVLLYAA